MYQKRKYREYTDKNIIDASQKVKNLAELLRELDLKPSGGNYANIKKKLQELDIDYSHWSGQAWNKGKRLKDWSEYTKVKSVKQHLINQRGHKCERCNLEKWENRPIPLEVDHINGDRTNNNENNLKILCCNCHALTPTWRGRKNKTDVKILCKICHKEISKQSKTGLCSPCFNKRNSSNKRNFCKNCNRAITRRSKSELCSRCVKLINRKIEKRPSKEHLLQEVNKSNYCAVGRKYGVSDNCIRKWLK